MKNDLPEIDIAGTAFYFDINKIALIEKDNPHNEIYFDNMRDEHIHYSFEYSKVSKNYHFVKSETTFDELHGNESGQSFSADPPLTVILPRIGEIDPKGMCQKYGCTESDIAQKADFEIMVNQEAYHKRLSGDPVKIDLAGNTYEIDVKNNVLRAESGPGEEIYLNAYHYDFYYEDEDVYHLFFDTNSNKVINVLQDGTAEKTDGRVILEVPNLTVLDPIGANIEYGYNPQRGLLYHDVKMHHIAEVVPWETYNIKIADHEQSMQSEPYANERGLPTIKIESTDFIVDVNTFELREVNNEKNAIRFEDMQEDENGYTFEYDLQEKNLPSTWSSNTITSVTIPEFVVLDPIGMGQKYNLSLTDLKNKTDFEVMVDQEAFDMRVNKGILPTVDIAGQTFYVDIRMDMLRPKNDFLSQGIVFDEIDHHFSEEKNAYIIPYDPKKHEYRELDYDQLLAVPKDLIIVEFPFQKELDPIGWNRKNGWDITEDLKHTGLKPHFEARSVPWKETFIHDIIKDNLKRVTDKPEEKNKQQKRGRKM